MNNFEPKRKDIEKINREIEKELLASLEKQKKVEENTEETISTKKLIFDLIVLTLLILIIITNVGLFIWNFF